MMIFHEKHRYFNVAESKLPTEFQRSTELNETLIENAKIRCSRICLQVSERAVEISRFSVLINMSRINMSRKINWIFCIYKNWVLLVTYVVRYTGYKNKPRFRSAFYLISNNLLCTCSINKIRNNKKISHRKTRKIQSFINRWKQKHLREEHENKSHHRSDVVRKSVSRAFRFRL